MRIVIHPNVENPVIIQGIFAPSEDAKEMVAIEFGKQDEDWVVKRNGNFPEDFLQANSMRLCITEAFNVAKQYIRPATNSILWTLHRKDGKKLSFYLGISEPEGKTIYEKHPELIKDDCYLVPTAADREGKLGYQVDEVDIDCYLVPISDIGSISHEIIYQKPDDFWVKINREGKAGEVLL